MTGPDEYTTVVNDNLFTNVMARFNLAMAAEVLVRIGTARQRATTDPLRPAASDHAEEVHEWAQGGQSMSIPYDSDHGGSTRRTPTSLTGRSGT